MHEATPYRASEEEERYSLTEEERGVIAKTARSLQVASTMTCVAAMSVFLRAIFAGTNTRAFDIGVYGLVPLAFALVMLLAGVQLARIRDGNEYKTIELGLRRLNLVFRVKGIFYLVAIGFVVVMMLVSTVMAFVI